jgi:hypothetical protein
MTRRLPALLLPAFVALGLALAGPSAAENPGWPGLAKEFTDKFKAKANVPLEQKKKAVNSLAKSNDARAAELLLSVVDDQAKYAAKLRKEWEAAETEWREKTAHFDEELAKLRQRATEQGKDTIEVPRDMDEWLGVTKQYEGRGKCMEVKKQNEMRYIGLVAEEDLVVGVLRGIARLLNSLEGEEYERAATKVVAAAQATKDARKELFVRALGYAKGEKVLGLLEQMSKDTNVSLVQLSLESMGRQNSERGADILISRLDDTRWQVRASAITGLSFYRNGAVVGKVMDALLERARKEDGVLQRNFFVGMAKITQEEVPATIEAWESWWKANREELIKKLSEREGSGMPLEDDPPDVMVVTNEGSSSFYGITTTSKHIIYVVDVSGSMSVDSKNPKNENPGPDDKSRIQVAREELKKALQTLTASETDDRGEASFNIVIFSTGVSVYKEGKMIDATKKAKEEAIEWVEKNVVADGMTNIYDGLEQAFNIISATSDAKNLKKGADTIFLMTDGLANRGKFTEDALIVSEIKRLNATRKMTIHTIGVGEMHNPKLLRDLAAANGGQYLAR